MLPKNKSIIVVFFIVLIGTVFSEESLPEQFQLIPQPQEISLQNGIGLGDTALEAVKFEDNITRPVMGDILSVLPQKDNIEESALTLKLATDTTVPVSEEGYVLVIKDGSATISARSQAGLFYGCQTLGLFELTLNKADCWIGGKCR